MAAKATILCLMVFAVTFAGCLSDEGAGPQKQTDDEGPAGTPSSKPVAEPTGGEYSNAGIGGGNVSFVEVIEDPLNVPVGLSRYLPVTTFEPTIGADEDGCLYYTHFRGTGAGTRIMKSCDQGLSWEEIGPDNAAGQPCFPNSNDPYVKVDRDTGRVFSSDLHALVTSTLHFTDDKGDTWTCNVTGGGLPPGVHDHQTIATGVPRTMTTVGYPNMVYYCVNRVADSVCASSVTGGLGFGPFIMVYPGVEENTLCGGLHGHAATDHEGRVYLPKGQCGKVEVAMSDDDGLTWTRSVVNSQTGVMGHEVRVAADEANNMYAFWVAANGLPYLAMSQDHGATWGETWMVGHPNVTAAGLPAVAAGADGTVAFAYIGIETEGGIGSPTNERAYNGYIGVIYDTYNATPTISTVTVNDRDDPLYRGNSCWSARCGGLGDFIDLTVDNDGRPWAAFSDSCHNTCVGPNGTQNSGDIALAGTFLQGRSLTTLEPLPPIMMPDEEEAMSI